jgi:replicative DNA helicase
VGAIDGGPRLPPQNVEAEQSVLGCMLLDREAVLRCEEMLRPEDFYREAHRRIFAAMIDLHERGEAVDMITLSEHLGRAGQLEALGGFSYLADLGNAVPSAANAVHYARIVQEKATLRRLLAAAADVERSVYDGADDAAEILDQAGNAFFQLAQERRQQPFAALRDVLVGAFERIEFLWEHKGEVLGVPTGLKRLDEMTTGLNPSELVILAARPSVGKTTLVLNWAAHAAQRKIPVGLFSLEMSREQLAMRLLASEARVDMQRLRSGYLLERDWGPLSNALSRLSESPILIDDTPNISILDLRARARRMRSEHGIGLLIIDYLQLMHTRGRAESRQQEISEISRSLKALARELECPVLACSQLSRAVEMREGRRPQLSDLRESGAIEQDADVVIFIYRDPEAEKDDQRRDEVELIVAKQRNGPTGVVKVAFKREIGRFERLAGESQGAPPPAVAEGSE